MPENIARKLEERARKNPKELDLFLRQEFERLSDAKKVQVMAEVIRRALLHIRTARAPGSDPLTFLAFIAGDTFEEVVLRPLEAVSGWRADHGDYARYRAKRIEKAVDERTAHLPIKSPMARFAALKKILLGSSLVAAGVGAALLTRVIKRARTREQHDTARK